MAMGVPPLTGNWQHLCKMKHYRSCHVTGCYVKNLRTWDGEHTGEQHTSISSIRLVDHTSSCLSTCASAILTVRRCDLPCQVSHKTIYITHQPDPTVGYATGREKCTGQQATSNMPSIASQKPGRPKIKNASKVGASGVVYIKLSPLMPVIPATWYVLFRKQNRALVHLILLQIHGSYVRE